MIIRTRYRDVPWEEIRNAHKLPTDAGRRYWEKSRGLKITILSGPLNPGMVTMTSNITKERVSCDGPFYLNQDNNCVVCPHTAEIGD